MFGLDWITLGGEHGVWAGALPSALRLGDAQFEALWARHPAVFHQVRLFGRTVNVPRWSETYGRDYRFSGTVQRAAPVPELLARCKAHVDARLNGLLVNWYDGTLGHKIGAHRDDEQELVAGAPIVTISFGERRTFRLRRWRGENKDRDGDRQRHDIEVTDGSVLVLPYATNMAFTHEVPASKRQAGRRISVTVRAFME